MVSYWWRILNIAVFDGKLGKPTQVQFGEYKGFWGMCRPTDYKFDGRLDLLLTYLYPSKRTFLEVLVHEMVHIFEYQTYGIMSHSTTFFDWKLEVKKAVDLNLSIKIRANHGQKRSKRSKGNQN